LKTVPEREANSRNEILAACEEIARRTGADIPVVAAERRYFCASIGQIAAYKTSCTPNAAKIPRLYLLDQRDGEQCPTACRKSPLPKCAKWELGKSNLDFAIAAYKPAMGGLATPPMRFPGLTSGRF
jgi:hypothetical protein